MQARRSRQRYGLLQAGDACCQYAWHSCVTCTVYQAGRRDDHADLT